MSIVITRTPEQFQPSKSDGLYFVVSANTTNQPKFRYTYNLYVDNYPVFQGKATPNPNGLGIIDVSRILDNYVQNYPISYFDTTPIFTHQTSIFSRPYSNEVVDYYIEVGYEYADSFIGNITGFTGIGNVVGNPSYASDTYKVFLGTMGVNGNANLPSFDIGKFVLSGTPTLPFPNTEDRLFLTNSPRIRDIGINEYYTLSFTNYELGGNLLSEPYYVKYEFYDINDILITAYTYSNIVSNGGGPNTLCTEDYYTTSFTGYGRNYNILNVGAGPKNIYNFPDETSYYRIQLFGKAETPPTPTPSSTPTPTPTQVTGGCYVVEFTNSSESSAPITYYDCCDNIISTFVEAFGTYTGCVDTTQSIFVPAEVSYTTTISGSSIICSYYPPCEDPNPCREYTITNNTFETGVTQYFTDCSGFTDSIYLQYGSAYTICLISYTSIAGITYVDNGECIAVTPTPIVVPPQLAIVRDCCTGQIELNVIVDASLSVGNSIVISGDCYEIYALGGNGSNGDQTLAANFINCNECRSLYPCDFDSEKPNVIKPSVEPGNHAAFSGSSPCVNYSAVSEVFQFNMRPDCDYFQNKQIMFKNRYGAWDYFLFEFYRSEGIGIDRSTYGQFNTTWASDNPIKTTYSRGTTDYQTGIVETHICNSGFLNDPEFVWLEELYTTNDAYLIETDGTLFPINIIGTEFVRKNKGNRAITNIELTYTYSNNIKLLNN